jgi:hypothetical protein
MTVYFPYRLSKAINACLPVVDKYTEMGRLRTPADLEHEYQRRLARDRSPFAFLYTDYRRQWGT